LKVKVSGRNNRRPSAIGLRQTVATKKKFPLERFSGYSVWGQEMRIEGKDGFRGAVAVLLVVAG